MQPSLGVGKFWCHTPGHRIILRRNIELDTRGTDVFNCHSCSSGFQVSHLCSWLSCPLLLTEAHHALHWGLCLAGEILTGLCKPCDLQLLTLGSGNHTWPGDRKKFFKMAKPMVGFQSLNTAGTKSLEYCRRFMLAFLGLRSSLPCSSFSKPPHKSRFGGVWAMILTHRL